MWKVIYIAPSQAVAERLKDLMAREGMLVTLRPVGGQVEGGAGAVELMVPKAEAREAHEVLAGLLRRTRL